MTSSQNKVEPLFTLNEYKNDVLYKKYEWKCKQCHAVFKHHIENGCIPRCPKCFPRKAIVSKEEKELYDILNNYNIKIIQNNRNLIPPYELDFYIPNYNLAIEFNGIYWHSIKVLTDKYYHQNKVQMCYNKGIRLLHIWEDEWIENSEDVKNKILYYIHNLDEEIKPREPILEDRKGFKIWT